MKGKAKGPWVTEAIHSMCLSNRKAALCLRDHGASSCTDVTGFGVLGHLVEMVNAQDDNEKNKTTAKLYLNSLPTLKGAIECIESGIFSSLQPHRGLPRTPARHKLPPKCPPRATMRPGAKKNILQL